MSKFLLLQHCSQISSSALHPKPPQYQQISAQLSLPMSTNYDVVVWIYDLSNGMAKSMSPMFLGRQIEAIYHTGIVVYGTEYFFGGGIAADRPGSTQAGAPIRKVKLGTTNKTQTEFHAWLHSVGDQYTAAKYNLMTHNCNNFAAAVAAFLLANIPDALPFPQEILDLPRLVLSTPMGQMFKPMFESMGPNQAGTSNSFIPTASQHLYLPDPLHNSPPQGTLTNLPTPAAPAASSTTATLATTTKTSDIDFHQITSMSEFNTVMYQALNTLPAEFPTMSHDQTYITKMNALLKASYKHPLLKPYQSIPAVTQAQADLDTVLSALTEKMKNPTTAAEPDFVKGLLALQTISGPYEAQSFVGNIGLYNLLLSQCLMKSILTSQESIATTHQITQGKVAHAVFDPLLLHNANGQSAQSTEGGSGENGYKSLNFDQFVAKCILVYKSDVIPALLGIESASTPKMNPAVLRLLNTGLEQFFFLTLQLSLTTQSQIATIKLLSSILDEYWGMVQKTHNVNSPSITSVTLPPSLNAANLNNIVKFALQLCSAYISVLKTDYQSRPPSFTAAKPIQLGVAEHASASKAAEAEVDALNESLTEFFLSSVLKLQDIFAAQMDSVQNDGVLKLLHFINYYLYIVSYIMCGTQPHCELLVSLDIIINDTVHTWHSVVSMAARKQQGNMGKDLLADIALFVKLLADFDAVLTIGNRD